MTWEGWNQQSELDMMMWNDSHLVYKFNDLHSSVIIKRHSIQKQIMTTKYGASFFCIFDHNYIITMIIITFNIDSRYQCMR